MGIESLEEQVHDWAAMMSAVSGLPIYEEKMDPQDLNSYLLDPEHIDDELPFEYRLRLGDGESGYELSLKVDFITEYTPGVWIPRNSWSIWYDDKCFAKGGGTIACGADLKSSDIRTEPRLKNARLQELLRDLGGPCSEVAFMDYETYSVESLEDHDCHSYFKNIYLMMMCHMKERGLTMPLILGNDRDIHDAMEAGDVEGLGELLESRYKAFGLPTYEGPLAHMKAEGKHLLEVADIIRQRKDPAVRLEEKFDWINYDTIPGKSDHKPYFILAVDNDMAGFFSAEVLSSLAEEPKYFGSRIISEIRLHGCMELCKTGQIDVVLFDWRDPSYWEAMMYGAADDAEENGDHQTITYNEDGEPEFETGNGDLFDIEGLKKRSEELDIREKWMNMIKDACFGEGVEAPPHLVIRSQRELRQLPKTLEKLL